MPDEAIRDPVLARFRAELDAMYGDNLDRVVLYGSRARGDAREDSDYDVAVFLKAMPDRWKELDQLADLSLSVFDDLDGGWVHAIPFRVAARDAQAPLMGEIRREGREL